MKVGIYTIHRANNFGAMLQAYATQYVINHLGAEAEIVNFYSEGESKKNSYVRKPSDLKSLIKSIFALVNPKIWKKCELFRDFHDSMPLSKKYASHDELWSCPPVYDIHLVGSDQVWNVERGLSEKPLFFLDFLKGDERRISYASSFGSTNIPSEVTNRIKEYLSNFSAISVRESSGVEYLKGQCGLSSKQVLDPTLLMTEDQWRSLNIGAPLVGGKYIAFYGFDKSENCRRIISTLRKRLNMPIVAVSVSTTVTSSYEIDHFIQAAGPLEFLNLFSNAAFILTGSFHGTAFAVNFRKDFVVLRFGKRMTRMESLLDILGLRSRIVSDENELNSLLDVSPSVDYSKGGVILETERQKSISWLKEALEL